MSVKRALVVDDSRSARAFLSRILERHELTVDSVESAEEAIDYLARQHPDVVFMDHLMTGMDGLQALKLIKEDPRTATIPILMYTSQEGELYLSQARALGALGVLPKQTRPADVTKALIQLRLVADRREPEATSETDEHPRPVFATPPATIHVTEASLDALTPELRRLVSALLNDHSSEMRRFVVEHLESHADRIVGDMRLLLKDDAPKAAAAKGRRSLWLPVLAAVAIACAGAMGFTWYTLMNSQRDMSAQLQGARAELGNLQTRLQVTAKQLGEARASVQSVRTVNTYVDRVPYGEAPLSGARIEHIQQRLEQLLAEGFRGRVVIVIYAGRFCLANTETAVLAVDDVPYAQCQQSTAGSGSTISNRESVAFANMIAAFRKKAGNAIEISLPTGSVDDASAAYPEVTEALTAGEWNAAAAQENRVELHWYAAS